MRKFWHLLQNMKQMCWSERRWSSRAWFSGCNTGWCSCSRSVTECRGLQMCWEDFSASMSGSRTWWTWREAGRSCDTDLSARSLQYPGGSCAGLSGFYEEEMSYRMLLDYPPAAHMLAVLGSGPEDELLVQAMHYLKLYVQRIYRRMTFMWSDLLMQQWEK